MLRAEQMLTYFADDDHGGFFRTAPDAEALIARPKEFYDGAMPSGNSCAAMVLQKLSELTADKRWMDASYRQHTFIAEHAEIYAHGVSYGLLSMMRSLHSHQELLCCGESDLSELRTYLSEHPANTLAILWKNKDNAERLQKLAPYTQLYDVPASGALWYLCTDGACALPEKSFDALKLS